MNEERQVDFIDLLSIMSFYIGLLNLDMNITQNDIEKQTSDIDRKVNEHLQDVLKIIQEHLKDQDLKLSQIQKQIGELKNDSK